MAAEPTRMFMLPETWGPAGGTPIGTIADLLAFGRTHLAGGVSPSGTRVLSAESTALMQQVSYDMDSPNVPPMGLGWVRYPFGDTTVLAMSGASPGGVSILCVVPEYDLVFTAFGNTPGAIMLQDQILQWLLSEQLGVEIPGLVTEFEQDVDLAPYVGTYRSDQLRIDVGIVDGQLEDALTAAIAEIDRDLRDRIAQLRRTRDNLAQLRGGDRLFVSQEVADYLDDLRELGISDRHIHLERDGWILMQTASPEDAAVWIAEKRDLLTDPEFRALILDHDAAYDWLPNDPRLPALADRTRNWFANHHSRSETQPVTNPRIARLAAQSHPGASSPAWDRLAHLMNG
ncbi:hypothetical protein [Nocardia gipuzkoensis]|uniref:hypothetical protein n=1 Tax=Nocardia gipuzkoensis TaxID=2749991 RepID=UPI003EE363BD